MYLKMEIISLSIPKAHAEWHMPAHQINTIMETKDGAHSLNPVCS